MGIFERLKSLKGLKSNNSICSRVANLTGRKVGWKEKGRKKDKNRRRHINKVKENRVSITQSPIFMVFCPIGSYAFTYTDTLAFTKFDFYLTPSLCFCIFHIPMLEVGTLIMFEFLSWIHSPSRDPTNTMHDWSSLTLFLFEITKTLPPKSLKSIS